MGLPLNSNWFRSISRRGRARKTERADMSRRSKWTAAPPSPKILHFPRTRRKPSSSHHQNESLIAMHQKHLSYKQNLSLSVQERRGRVEEPDGFQWKTLLTTQTELPLIKNRVKIEGREKVFERGEESEKRSGIRDGKGSVLGEGKEKGLQQQARMKMVEGDDCSASTSKRIDTHLFQESSMGDHENRCSGRCKAVVRRIMEQVRAETEEWSQMQQMMRQVRGELEELQASRDYWQTRARNADYEIQSLKHAVEEWKHRALYHETKANKVASLLKEKENKGSVEPQRHQPEPLSLGKQLAKEKRMRRHACTESKQEDGTLSSMMNRSPLRNIGNSATLPIYNRLHLRRGSFRK